MSTFPEHAQAFLTWAFQDLAKAAEILDRHPKLIRSTNSLGETVLHYLAVEGRAEAVELLLKRGAVVDTRDFSNATPLHHAAQLGYVDLVRLLLFHEADVKAVDHNQETALHFAARSKGAAEIVSLLLQAGADVNAFSGLERPLDTALKAGRKDAADLLLAAGGVETEWKAE
jgi:ankyrin repeat protein